MQIVKIRPNGKIDVRTSDGAKVVFDRQLNHLAGRFLSVDEFATVVRLVGAR